MIHAGGENSFVENALLMWKADSNTEDYHSQMNFQNYEKWLREKLIPNLPPNLSLLLITRQITMSFWSEHLLRTAKGGHD
jgi:hypothetical protein